MLDHYAEKCAKVEPRGLLNPLQGKLELMGVLSGSDPAGQATIAAGMEAGDPLVSTSATGGSRDQSNLTQIFRVGYGDRSLRARPGGRGGLARLILGKTLPDPVSPGPARARKRPVIPIAGCLTHLPHGLRVSMAGKCEALAFLKKRTGSLPVSFKDCNSQCRLTVPGPD
jgi:hypothetical protein